ncbi:hypothetical protein GCM10023192_73480 [Amycolatopsis samaneae]
MAACWSMGRSLLELPPLPMQLADQLSAGLLALRAGHVFITTRLNELLSRASGHGIPPLWLGWNGIGREHVGLES